MRENDLSASVSLLKLAELQDENCLARDSDLLSPCLRVLLAFQILRLKIRERLLFAGSVLLEVPGSAKKPRKRREQPRFAIRNASTNYVGAGGCGPL